jgi:competence protein ComEA
MEEGKMTSWIMSNATAKTKRVFLALVLACGGLGMGQGVLAAQDTALATVPPAVNALQVNVNEADAETIADVLVGVGMSKAQAIVDYREEHGPFQDLHDLIEVRGIGEATLENNRERIRLE